MLVGNPLDTSAQIFLDLLHRGPNDRLHVRDLVAIFRTDDQMEEPWISGSAPSCGDFVTIHSIGGFRKPDHLFLLMAVIIPALMGHIAHQTANAADLMVSQLHNRPLH